MADIEVLDEVKKIISDEFGIPEEDIEEDSELDADLGITDLEFEDLWLLLAKKFNFSQEPENYSKFNKVSDLVTYIYENSEETP